MKNVLIINPYYLPGYKSGGPQQTVQNICDSYCGKSHIFLMTLNHDFNSSIPYNIPNNEWININGIRVNYLPDNKYNISSFRKALIGKDCVLACGLFCKGTIKNLILHKLSRNKVKLYVAPMGVFSPNAYSSKGYKKKIFNILFSHLGLYENVIWSFTSKRELEDAICAIGSKYISSYIIAEDLPRKIDHTESLNKLAAHNDLMKIVFLSRISPMKNLEYALEILRGVQEKIVFDIYGIIENADYWSSCSRIIDELPSNISVNYLGEVTPSESVNTFSKYDVFLFPTKGENYGHVIYESLSAGCIPIISNNTPWNDLEENKCGNVIDLGNIELFRNAIKFYHDLNSEDLKQYKINAINYARDKYISSTENSGYNEIFL